MAFEDSALAKKFFNPDEKTEGSTFMAIAVGMFAAFGGILYGYDTGTISGILGMSYVLKTFPEKEPGVNGAEGVFTSGEHSLIVSILSAGTFVGALIAPYISDNYGRRWTLIISTGVVFNIGVILQTVATDINTMVAGRAIGGLGVGLLSSCVPLYQSEATPRWIRGAVVSCYQWAITIGLLLASLVNQSTHNIDSAASYRIPIALQFLWSIIIAVGMFFLPDTPRFWVHKGNRDEAMKSLSKLRRLPESHPVLIDELGEIIANYEFDLAHGKAGWADCFKSSNNQLKRLITGVFLQAFQQLTGINFIFYYGTTFFKNSGIQNEFLISLVTNIVNVVSTIPGILLVEMAGRRNLLLAGAIGMSASELLIAIIGTATDTDAANICLIIFVCVFIAFFAATWGPLCWVVCGEIFPLQTRAKSVAMSISSNWLWNFAIAYATPYLVDDAPGSARLGSKVFFIWGGCNFLCFFFAYYFVYETKGLSLEQVDEMYAAVPKAWNSKDFVPTDHNFSKKIANEEFEDKPVEVVEETKEAAVVEKRSSGELSA